MKLFVFTDVHANIRLMRKLTERVKKEVPDLVVCCGDFTVFEQNIKSVMHWLAQLHKNVLLIHGNHETTRVKTICPPNVHFIHKTIKHVSGQAFLGWGGGGFSITEPGFDAFVRKYEKELKTPIILVTHAPPYGTRCDKIGNQHVGNKSFTRFIKAHNVTHALCGHLHENFGKQDFIGKTRVVNPGPLGMVIEL